MWQTLLLALFLILPGRPNEAKPRPTSPVTRWWPSRPPNSRATTALLTRSTAGRPLIVQEVKGSRLLVRNGHAGWLDAADVLPLDAASPISPTPSARTPRTLRPTLPGACMGQRANRQGDRRLQRSAAARSEIPEGLRRPRRCPDEKGDPDKAIADFNEALRIDPKCSKVYVCRGYTG